MFSVSEESIAAIIGATIGAVATAFGAALTYWLTVIAERRKEENELRSLLKTVQLEAQNIEKIAPKVGIVVLPKPIGAELLQSKGLLPSLRSDTAAAILQFLDAVNDLNRVVLLIQTSAQAKIAAGEGAVGSSFRSELRSRIKQLVEESVAAASKCIVAIDHELKLRK